MAYRLDYANGTMPLHQPRVEDRRIRDGSDAGSLCRYPEERWTTSKQLPTDPLPGGHEPDDGHEEEE